MIVFDIRCTKGHSFEGWFEDGEAYKDQKRNGLISCPVCSDINVSRMPSAFSIKSRPLDKTSKKPPVDIHELSNKILDYIEKNFDDVGTQFTDEALKIHYGVSEPRNIKGVSSKEEEKTLKKEGVNFFKIPIPVGSDTDS